MKKAGVTALLLSVTLIVFCFGMFESLSGSSGMTHTIRVNGQPLPKPVHPRYSRASINGIPVSYASATLDKDYESCVNSLNDRWSKEGFLVRTVLNKEMAHVSTVDYKDDVFHSAVLYPSGRGRTEALTFDVGLGLPEQLSRYGRVIPAWIQAEKALHYIEQLNDAVQETYAYISTFSIKSSRMRFDRRMTAENWCIDRASSEKKGDIVLYKKEDNECLALFVPMPEKQSTYHWVTFIIKEQG